MADVVDALVQALGPEAVLTGEAVHERRAGIWRKDHIAAKALLRPDSTATVSRALAICNEFRQPVVAHGGLTGLVESAITAPEDVALSLERLDRIEAIDPVNRTMTVQSGVVLQTLQEAAEAEGLMFPLDLGARGSCTIGGNIATNAGGNRVIRFGMTRDMVLGLEAVLADGTVLSSMNRMIKNNAGYDLKQLFIGSEGTLGVVTRAVLRLREQPRSVATLLVAVEEFDRLPALLKHLDGALGGAVSAFEVMWRAFYSLVTTDPAPHLPPIPGEYPYYVLIEVMGAGTDRVEEALADALDRVLIADAVMAQSEQQRGQLWAMRDDVAQCFRYAPTITFDVSLPVSAMAGYVDEVDGRLRERFPEMRNFVFGHMGDGNLHLVVAPGERGGDVRAQVEACVYEPLAALGGSVSAEHGVGLEKRPYLSICRSAAEIELMRRLKAALDPHGILNPGKIFEPAAAAGQAA